MKIGIKEILSILGYIIAAGSFIFALGISKANKENNTADLSEKVTKLEQTVNTFSKDQQNLILTVDDIKVKFDNYIMKQDKLTVNFLKLAMNISESNAELMTYMNGLTFEVVQDEPMKSVFPNPKIKIIPIKK
jgi:hypothetical protein